MKTLTPADAAVARDALLMAHDYYSTKPDDDPENFTKAQRRAMWAKARKAADLYRRLGGGRTLLTPEDD